MYTNAAFVFRREIIKESCIVCRRFAIAYESVFMGGNRIVYISVRLKFSRLGPVRYLGHLDMLRYFQKAVMRSGLPVRYSEGFNPHQIISFAYPLGVSMETIGDYLDLDLVEADEFTFADAKDKENYEKNIVNSLNSVMQEGICILKASILPEGALNAMASVYAADYEVYYSQAAEIEPEIISRFLARKEIYVQKEGKKGIIKETDIREGILCLEKKENNILFMKLRSGSECNIKPSTIIDLLKEFAYPDIKLEKVKRLEIYKCIDGRIAALGDESFICRQ